MADADQESVLTHLAFPLRGGSLLVIIVFTPLLTLAYAAGLFGIWLGFVLIVLLSGYAFRLMDSVAEGRPEPPVMGAELLSGATERRPVWLGFTVVTAYWLVQALQTFAPGWLATATAVSMFALLPAAIALLGLRHADPYNVLNPVALVLTARELGSYYFAALLSIVMALALSKLASGITLATPIFLMVQLYALLVVFSVTGGALYSRRHALGTNTVRSPEQYDARLARDEERDRDVFLDEVYQLVRVERIRDAYQRLQQGLNEFAGDTPQQQSVFRSLGRWDDKSLALIFGRDLVSTLIENKQSGAALEIAERCLSWEPEFRPAHAAEAIRLANYARHSGHAGIGRQLLADFEMRYPNDPAREIALRLREEISV
jgi:hypothetical protein